MGGRREVSSLSHRPVTSSNLKQERLCFRESVSTFLQLVVATCKPSTCKKSKNQENRNIVVVV